MTTSQISDTLMDILFCLGEQSGPQACRLCHPWLYAGRENESSMYWLSVLNELKNRGVKDILILCSDGLTALRRPYRQHSRRRSSSAASRIWYATHSNMSLTKTGKPSPQI